MNKYTPVIGLEIHVELATENKMFCQCSAEWFGKEPNTNNCPVCLGLPGALPVPNRKAIEWTIKIAQALGCSINTSSKFDRKHYFYADLPKGYQISQYDEPIGINGSVEINGKKFRIHRVHLEEDTGKLIHQGADSLVDFNRSGVPLVEIVTEADFSSSEDAKAFLEELQLIIRYLGVSQADMEKGSMRLEPNISLRREGEEGLPPYKVEVKNINSFNFVKQAIEFEFKRQAEILDKGETPVQETRGYNENKKITFSQRSKEEAHDYRYFPEPDIPPLVFEQPYIDELRKSLPELPADKRRKFVETYKLKESDTAVILRSAALTAVFENLAADDKLKSIEPQMVANLLVNKKIDMSKEPDVLVQEILTLAEAKSSQKNQSIDEGVLDKVLRENAQAVSDFKAGKETVLMFLVGQVMRELKGQADASQIKDALLAKLR